MPPTSTAVWGRTCRWFRGPSWWQSAAATRKPKGYNALGYREVLGIAVGDSETKVFWRQFLGSI